MTKQRAIRRISTNRDLFVRSSFSWYHSNLGGGTEMNWQWNTASSFFNTTTSLGETTGRGKLLSAKKKRKKKDGQTFVWLLVQIIRPSSSICVDAQPLQKEWRLGLLKPTAQNSCEKERNQPVVSQQLRWKAWMKSMRAAEKKLNAFLMINLMAFKHRWQDVHQHHQVYTPIGVLTAIPQYWSMDLKVAFKVTLCVFLF